MVTAYLVLLLAFSASALTAEKPGKCIGRFFIALACEPHEVVNTCNGDDYQCPGNEKCCRTARCVTSCEPPAAPKPGECPDPSRVEQGPHANCDEDTDCGTNNDQKCCKNESGATRCAAPRGTCPDTSGIITTCQVTEDNCFSDRGCLGDKICCSYGCGKRCLSPVS